MQQHCSFILQIRKWKIEKNKSFLTQPTMSTLVRHKVLIMIINTLLEAGHYFWGIRCLSTVKFTIKFKICGITTHGTIKH